MKITTYKTNSDSIFYFWMNFFLRFVNSIFAHFYWNKTKQLEINNILQIFI